MVKLIIYATFTCRWFNSIFPHFHITVGIHWKMSIIFLLYRDITQGTLDWTTTKGEKKSTAKRHTNLPNTKNILGVFLRRYCHHHTRVIPQLVQMLHDNYYLAFLWSRNAWSLLRSLLLMMMVSAVLLDQVDGVTRYIEIHFMRPECPICKIAHDEKSFIWTPQR